MFSYIGNLQTLIFLIGIGGMAGKDFTRSGFEALQYTYFLNKTFQGKRVPDQVTALNSPFYGYKAEMKEYRLRSMQEFINQIPGTMTNVLDGEMIAQPLTTEQTEVVDNYNSFYADSPIIVSVHYYTVNSNTIQPKLNGEW